MSSHQLDEPERGFSFQTDGPLDMRMGRQQTLRACDLVNTAAPEELARLFWEYGDERESRRIARAIVGEREKHAIETTLHLAGLIERVSPRRGRASHPATRVFQALRMAVNDELGCLRRGLEVATRLLRVGGRLVVITFHSTEDRLVKRFGRERSRAYRVEGELDVPELRQPCQPELCPVSRKALRPSAEELAVNPRSRSAQMRSWERV